MNSLKDILREEYRKKANTIDPKTLMEMVEETLDLVYDTVVVNTKEPIQEIEASKAKEFLLVLPKFAPTEAWGDPNSMDRQQINRLFNVIGGGYSIEGKLEFLQRIADERNKITSPRRIISSLIILEALKAVLNSFNSSSAGFVFEGFMSALFKGSQVTDTSDKGNLPIQDIIAFENTGNPTPVSLKLLNQTTKIEGSYTNLVDGIDEFGRMVYIVARKDGDRLALEQFTFTKENFIDALVKSAKGDEKAVGLALFKLPNLSAKESIEKLKSMVDWNEKYKLLQYTNGYDSRVRAKRKTAHDEKEGGVDLDPKTPYEEASRQKGELLTEEEEGKGGGGKQWVITALQLKSFSFVDYRTYGFLPYSEKQIEKVAKMHMSKLNDELYNLFSATKTLSENITQYFTHERRDNAIRSGERAVRNTVEIQNALTAQISVTDSEEGP